MPDHIPKVEEIGATSAPLMSAAYFIGDRCQAYNDDFMKCKDQANGRGEFECLKEGRKVTRCAASVYVPQYQSKVHWQSVTAPPTAETELLVDPLQYQGYQHPLPEAVPSALGVSGE